MDPISAAGIGLSVASLALQLFAGCIHGYQIFLDTAGMPESFEHLRVRMRIEQIRLLSWGEKVGLLEDMLDRPSVTLQLHRNLIIDMLLAIQRYLSEFTRVEEKYVSAVSVNSITTVNAVIPDPGPPTGSAVLLRKMRKALEKTSQVPKRLKWAVVTQERFEKLVERLISYNDSVVSLLDRASIDKLQEIQMQTHLIMLQMSTKIDELHQFSSAMQIKASTDSGAAYIYQSLSSPSSDRSPEDDHSSLSQLAKFKAQQTLIESRSTGGRSRLVDKNAVTSISSRTSRSRAIYLNQPVWIEWKEWDPNHQLQSWPSMIEERVTKLATLLSLPDKPGDFRAPTCVGFFDDRDDDVARYGLIYKQPKDSTPNSAPTSLLDLIRTAEPPSLTQRAVLAHAIAQSLMFLHSVNWIHKGFRSANIVFFAIPGQTPNHTDPTVSGFEYARPDLPSEMTEKPLLNLSHDIYRHPDALANSTSRSKKSWDIYSLGVVLVEIALWRDISSIVSFKETQRGALTRLRQIRKTLLQADFMTKLGAAAGERYKNAAKRCLAGGTSIGVQEDDDESDPHVGAAMLQVFQSEIVGKLADIKL